MCAIVSRLSEQLPSLARFLLPIDAMRDMGGCLVNLAAVRRNMHQKQACKQ